MFDSCEPYGYDECPDTYNHCNDPNAKPIEVLLLGSPILVDLLSPHKSW
jgi:hypothetical protein